MVLNYIRNWDFSEVVISALKVGSVNGINMRFRERNLYIFQSPTVKLKLEMWGIGFTVFLKCA